MDTKTLEALKAGVLSGSLIAAIFSLPVLVILASIALATSPEGAPESYYALIGTLYQCICVIPFFSVAIAAFSSVVALRWSRSALASLNEAVHVSLLTSALTAGIGTIMPLVLFDLLAVYSHYAGSVYGLSLLIGALGLSFFGMLSFFGGLMYGVYAIDLRYVHGTGEK